MRLPRILLVFALAASAHRLAATTEALPVWSVSSVTAETGLLWQAGKNTPLAYRLIPTQLSWRSPRKFGRTFADGSHLLVRHRLTLLGTYVQQGPESHYVGVIASPSIERWNRRGTWCLFGGAGGGFGWLDSQGVVGGQGQDFTFNWMARLGVEHVTSRRGSWNAGVLFQHLSNRGQTNPNPGIDAVGFTAGYAWAF